MSANLQVATVFVLARALNVADCKKNNRVFNEKWEGIPERFLTAAIMALGKCSAAVAAEVIKSWMESDAIHDHTDRAKGKNGRFPYTLYFQGPKQSRSGGNLATDAAEIAKSLGLM